MKNRTKKYGNCNLVGQIRIATDKELFVIAKILDVKTDELF